MSTQHDFQIQGRARLVVSVPDGRLDVYRVDDDRVQIEIGGDDADLDVSATGNAVSILASKRRFRGSVRIAAGVPAHSDLEVSGASIDVHADTALGDVRTRTASGDVSLDDVGSLSVRSASGDVRVARVAGDLDLALASGDVYAEDVNGNVSGSVASGDVRMGRVSGDVSLKSASGDIRLEWASGRSVEVKSMSGSIVVRVARGTRVHLDMSTVTGDIRRPTSESPSARDPERTMDLRVKTVSGDIHLERAD